MEKLARGHSVIKEWSPGLKWWDIHTLPLGRERVNPHPALHEAAGRGHPQFLQRPEATRADVGSCARRSPPVCRDQAAVWTWGEGRKRALCIFERTFRLGLASWVQPYRDESL